MPNHGRGLALAALGDFDGAVVDHIEAIRISPNAAEAHNHFAEFWALCPDRTRRDGKVALELATRACELSAWEDATCVGTLAAAHAELGQLDQAVAWAERAAALAAPLQRHWFTVRLDEYRARWRGEPIN
jgi:tetratricopeptide (TPR) repeat protein